ncbi:DnaB-like helicase N-terminal domain-containing protein [Picosynechococcus sp. PCC 8807]|uniref:DnaB-like helicase N-terminal domain-containing protein n=1 Tax=Picosynechococcus sp. PCC 8807 TaxID=195248 RepID=UPI0008106D6F|nr:DnaB-like helicase N-terminal domain-containing protein [Picosynechococcus sp. PCC 8807]ANV90879.1 hypothetical protein AWQ24_09675 [Picosynechococcus sp. PCC 8807]
MYSNSLATNKVTPIFSDRSLPPQNLEAEEMILGGILMGGAAALARVKHILEPEAFYVSAHRQIYQEFLKLDQKNLRIDLLTVISTLSAKKKFFETIGGTAKLSLLVDRTVSDVNLDHYADLVQQAFLRRQAIAIAEEVISHAYSRDTPVSDLANVIRDRFTEITASPLVTGEAKSIKLHQCDRLLEKLNHIQLDIDSPTYKEFMLQELARETGRSPAQLQSLFYKSLIEDEWEPTLSLSQLRDKYGDQVREWLLHGFIPKGATTLLHALGGQGKTRLLYDFIYHLALGESWQGFPVTKKAKILIIQTDEQPVDMLAALEVRGIRPDDPRFDIHYKTRWSTEHIPQLYREVQNERYDLILIDSLASVSRFSTVSENDAEFAKPILLLNKIAADFNTAIMLVHHSSKSGDARGTTAVYNAVSQVFQLTKDPQDLNPSSCERILCIQKSRARRPAKYALVFNPEEGSWVCEGEATLTPDPDSSLKEQVSQFLSQHRGVKFGSRDLAEALNFNTNSVRKVLGQLAADGIISWRKQGRSKTYWIDAFEGMVKGRLTDPPMDQVGSVADQFVDQFANPDGAKDVAPTDPLIQKNEKFLRKKSGEKTDQRIRSSKTQSGHKTQTDPPSGSVRISSDQVDQLDQIEKGDRVTVAQGCEIYPKVGILWEAGTILEVLDIGRKGIYSNQLQVKRLGDNSHAAWVPIANIEINHVSKEV